ncbi:hypothetical protein BIW11_05562, partial [Tropilaelaps mercedesae]
MATKRNAAEALDGGLDESPKPLCKWGPLCYRKNPDHLKEFAHPHRTPVPTKTKPADRSRFKATPAKPGRPPAFPSSDGSAKKMTVPLGEVKTPPKP